MNKHAHMITIFKESDINGVAIRLGECQHYSDKISRQILSNNGVDVRKDHLDLFKLLNLLNKRKDITVSFYCVKEKELFYIFSDFFNLEGAFSDAFSFFDDMNSVFMMSEINGNCLYISLIKRGESFFQFAVDIVNQGNYIPDTWQQDYKKMFDTVSGLPSVFDVGNSLKYMLQNFRKSDEEMHNYLAKNALFVDRYII